jgi:hypothetical protein
MQLETLVPPSQAFSLTQSPLSALKAGAAADSDNICECYRAVEQKGVALEEPRRYPRNGMNSAREVRRSARIVSNLSNGRRGDVRLRKLQFASKSLTGRKRRSETESGKDFPHTLPERADRRVSAA